MPNKLLYFSDNNTLRLINFMMIDIFQYIIMQQNPQLLLNSFSNKIAFQSLGIYLNRDQKKSMKFII